MMAILYTNYADWQLSDEQFKIWKHVLTSKTSNELLPRIIEEWIANESKPPKTPADLVNYLGANLKKQFGSAEAESDIIISSARKAYYVTDDFQTFADE